MTEDQPHPKSPACSGSIAETSPRSSDGPGTLESGRACAILFNQDVHLVLKRSDPLQLEVEAPRISFNRASNRSDRVATARITRLYTRTFALLRSGLGRCRPIALIER
jgi:hypothetical protein